MRLGSWGRSFCVGAGIYLSAAVVAPDAAAVVAPASAADVVAAPAADSTDNAVGES